MPGMTGLRGILNMYYWAIPPESGSSTSLPRAYVCGGRGGGADAVMDLPGDRGQC